MVLLLCGNKILSLRSLTLAADLDGHVLAIKPLLQFPVELLNLQV